jgi:hypothetical protein
MNEIFALFIAQWCVVEKGFLIESISATGVPSVQLRGIFCKPPQVLEYFNRVQRQPPDPGGGPLNIPFNEPPLLNEKWNVTRVTTAICAPQAAVKGRSVKFLLIISRQAVRIGSVKIPS